MKRHYPLASLLVLSVLGAAPSPPNQATPTRSCPAAHWTPRMNAAFGRYLDDNGLRPRFDSLDQGEAQLWMDAFAAGWLARND